MVPQSSDLRLPNVTIVQKIRFHLSVIVMLHNSVNSPDKTRICPFLNELIDLACTTDFGKDIPWFSHSERESIFLTFIFAIWVDNFKK